MSEFDTFQEGNEENTLVINLNEVAEQSFDPLPKGNYPVVVSESEFAISKTSGKPMWKVTYTVLSGEFENRKLWGFLSFSEKALPMTKSAIKALDPTLISDTFDVKAAEGILGKTALAKVGIRKGEGEYSDQNDIKGLKPYNADMDSGDVF